MFFMFRFTCFSCAMAFFLRSGPYPRSVVEVIINLVLFAMVVISWTYAIYGGRYLSKLVKENGGEPLTKNFISDEL